jgi:hypothetical protein
MKPYGKIIAAAVVFVIIGMPMLSYFYLRQGLSFRIDAIEALKQSNEDIQLTKDLVPQIEIKGDLVNAIADIDDVSLSQMNEVYEKYQGNKYFTLATYSNSNQTSTWGEKHRLLSSSPGLDKIFESKDLILIDTSGQVRESYEYSEKNFKSFIQHLSVLLPVESSKKIKLER